MTIPALLFRLFRPGDARSLDIAPASVHLRYRGRLLRLPHHRIAAVQIRRRPGFVNLVLHTGGSTHTLPGLSRSRAAALALAIETAREDWWRAAIGAEAPTLDTLRRSLDWLDDPPEHIGDAAGARLAATARATVEALSGHWPKTLRDTPEFASLEAVREFAANPEDALDAANLRFIARELGEARDLFDRIESRPLTDEQRRAVVVDSRRNLVIASAGSGKTSVIVAKAAWLIRKGLRQPSEILLLAFARDARGEMEDRIASRFGATAPEGLAVKTFHALGLSILRDVDGRAPSLSHTADDPPRLMALLKEIVAELIADPAHATALMSWLQNRFEPDRGEHEFANLGEYYDYIRQFDLRSLKGERVKSFGECQIANHLYLNGVAYEYEAHYEHDTATAKRRQYRPDFRLPEAGVYIEHFGLDARGRPPPYLDGDAYLRQRAWKLALHKKHGTDLIETFSHQRANGILSRVLSNELAKRGIAQAPIPTEKVFAALEEQGRIDPFIRLAATFLHHFNGAGLSYDQLAARIAATRGRERGQAFLAVFRPIAEAYRRILHERGLIDFNDMIHRAARLVEEGRYRSQWTYLLIDEFQDISPARARLLKALVDQSPGNRLFAVGDDWQAISRFAGSDISIMRDFEEHFGEAAQLRLETTFRCPDRLAEAATRFVLRNPAQIPKTVRSPRRAAGPCIHVGLAARPGMPLLHEALNLAARDAERLEGKPDVLILGRYNRLKPDLRPLSHAWRGLSLSFRTIHASKGLEADYVIVLGLNGGKFAFPTGISDDPLLDLVLSRRETHPNAEERRLLYVALTRARRHVFLIAGEGPPSSFATELLHGGYDIALFGRRPAPETPCPACTGGRLRQREHPRTGETFYGCSNYPLCKHSQPACPACGTGLPVRQQHGFECRDCGIELAACPQCDGWLHTKTGRSGEFLGCSNYPRCGYTRSIGHDTARRSGAPGRAL